MFAMKDSYARKNNDLVENFLLALRSEISGREASNSFIHNWKCIINLPYHHMNVTLILVSSCNLMLSQMLHDYSQLDCASVLSVCYKALNKVVWWEPSIYHSHLVGNPPDLIQEITKMFDNFINHEELFLQAGSSLIYMCTLTYLFSMNKTLLELIKKAIKRKAALQNDCCTECSKLFILTPSCNAFIQLNQEETSNSIFEFAQSITEMGSTSPGHETKNDILPHYIQVCFGVAKQFSKTCPSVLQEFLRNYHNPMSSCLSSSIIAAHLLTSTKPALVIKLLSLSLRETEESLAAVQASSASNVVYQLQTSHSHSMLDIALDLAEGDLLRYALTDFSQQPHKDVDIFMLTMFQLLSIPSPSWVKLILARMLLWQKRYDDAIEKYYELITSPICYKKAEERKGRLTMIPSPDFEVLIHELALGLFLSNKVHELREFLANWNTPDFLMLIIQTKLFLKLGQLEDGVKALNRALINLEHSPIDSNEKDLIYDICHLKLEQLVCVRPSMRDNRELSIFSPPNKDERLPVCPSCNRTSTSSYENCYQFSKDLVICHLFHEV